MNTFPILRSGDRNAAVRVMQYSTCWKTEAWP